MAKTSFFHFLFLLLLANVALQLVKALPPVYIFGDSTFDVGTNNFFPESKARANFPHNGIDFRNSVPTGRFSNGLNSADHIVELLGYNRSPQPYLYLANRTFSFKKNIREGVNFASGGSGILSNTGNRTQVKVVPLEEQIQQFATVYGNLTEWLGPDSAAKLLSQSFFLISVGSNDIFDYLTYDQNNLSATQLVENLESTYKLHLTNLSMMGARKFAIISVPPIGCCPAARINNATGGCIDEANAIAQAFYNATEILLQNLSAILPGMNYSLGNAYLMTTRVIEDPGRAGLTNVQSACCGGGWLNGEYQCNKTANLCPNRTEYLFWDRFHPTDEVANLAALQLYQGQPPLVSPMNFSQLALINL